MATSAAQGATPPPGTWNGTPPARTSRRRSCQAARQHAPYRQSALAVARMASRSNVLVMARAQAIADWVAMATCGVRKRGWTAAMARGRKPSRPSANRARGTARTWPLRQPSIETAAPTRMTDRPGGPNIRPPTSASGVPEEARSAPRTPWATSCRPTYITVTVAMARKIARGTVRATSRTSPLGARAISIPAKANTSRIDVREMAAAGGRSVQRRRAGSMKNGPAARRTSRGTTFTAVAAVLNRVPSFTPKTWRALSAMKTATRNTADPSRPPAMGASCPALAANTVARAAVANVHSIQNTTPARKPTKGPNAVST